MPDNLAKRSIKSVTWNAMSSVAQVVLGFIQFAILARLLDPVVFGVYAQASATIVLFATLPSFGLASAYLHRAQHTQDIDQATSTFFTLRLLLTLVWVALMLFGLSLLGGLRDPAMRTAYLLILATQSIGQLNQPLRTVLVRKVEHRRLAIIDTIDTTVTAIVTSVLALFGATLWALLAADIIEAAVNFFMLYIWRPVWRPRLTWSWPAVRYFLGFGGENLLGRSLQMSLDRLDDLWTGVYLGKTALGYYSRAYKFAKYPSAFLATPVNNVAAGTYAELKGDRHNLSLAFARTNALMVRTGFFMAAVLSLVAPEFIVIVMGARWLPILDAFRLMLVFTLFDPMKQTIASMFNAVGRPMTVVKVRAFQLVVMVAGMYLMGHGLGIAGVALAVDLMLVLGIAIVLYLARKYVDFSMKDLFLAPVLAVAAGMGLALCVAALLPAISSPVLSAAIDFVLFTIGYGGVLLLLDRQNLGDLIFLLNKYLLPKKLRNRIASQFASRRSPS